jgi:hypothetical protein
LVGAAFYWNARKSAYGLRGRRGRCPCQNESDDPIPGHVRCDAVLSLHEPGRFRRICPLLVPTPEGWRCSVAPAGVRPFWGRVVGWTFLAALGCWLAGVTAVWGALHAGRLRSVEWAQLAWPGRWPEIRRTQSRELFVQAIADFRQGRWEAAQLALSTAREIDPANCDAALMLAQIAMFQRSFHFSDDLFARLLQDFPAERDRTAVTYHDTLLSLGRMDRLGAFALEMAGHDRARAVVWVRSALVAVRQLPADEVAAFRTRVGPHLTVLAPHARLLITAELEQRAGRAGAAVAILRAPFRGPVNSFYLEYQLRRLAELGAPAEAQMLLNATGPALPEFERRLTQVRLAMRAGDDVLAQAVFASLLDRPLNGIQAERILELLIAAPNAGWFRLLHARISQDAPFVAVTNGAAFWLVASICGDAEAADFWRTHGTQVLAPAAYPSFQRPNFSNWDAVAPDSPLRLINELTLPRDVILALLARMEPPANRPSPPARR